MPQPILRPLLLLVTCCAAYAQAVGPKLEFETASIKLSPPPDPRGTTIGWHGGPDSDDPGMFRGQNLSLLNLITMAYSVKTFQVAAPDCARTPAFDIDAKIMPGTTKEQFHAMLQNLLIDRFKLAVHHESKEVAKYDLVLAKNGPKLKESEVDTTPKDPNAPPPAPPRRFPADKDGCPVLPRLGYEIMTSSSAGLYGWYEPKYSMEMFAGWLSGSLGKPVTDASGLKGQYEISLCRAPDSPPSARASASTASLPDGPIMIDAVQDQVGLRLESKRGPADFLVVDHIEKLPTEN